MEKDGTIVDDNDVLQYCSTETFMLLQSGEFGHLKMKQNCTVRHLAILSL